MLSWHNVSCHLVLPHNRRATVFAGSKDEKDRRNETILLEVSLGLSHFLLTKERVSHLTQLPERSYTPSRQNLLRSLLPCSKTKHSPQGTAERVTRYKLDTRSSRSPQSPQSKDLTVGHLEVTDEQWGRGASNRSCGKHKRHPSTRQCSMATPGSWPRYGLVLWKNVSGILRITAPSTYFFYILILSLVLEHPNILGPE